MGVSLMWLPVEGGNHLDASARSNVHGILRDWVGIPGELDDSMIPVLHGMEMADPTEKAWPALIEALRENERIRVWGEW